MGVEARSEVILSPEGDVVRIHQLESVLGEAMQYSKHSDSLEAQFVPGYFDGLQNTISDLRFERAMLHKIIVAALRQYGDIHVSDLLLYAIDDDRFESFKDEENRRTVIRLEK